MTGVWSWVKRVAQEPHHHHSRAEKLRDGKAGRVTLHYCFKTGAVGSSRALVAHIVTDIPASVGTQLLHPKETWPWGCGSFAFSSWRDVTCYKLSLLISTNLFEPSRGVVLSYSSRGIFLAKVTSQTSFVGHKKKKSSVYPRMMWGKKTCEMRLWAFSRPWEHILPLRFQALEDIHSLN